MRHIRVGSKLAWVIGAALLIGSANADIYYVDAVNGRLPGDMPPPAPGSWATAYRGLQDAMDAASPGDEVWMTQGNYSPPGALACLRDGTFEMRDGVDVYGGFPFGAADGDFSARDPSTYHTILNGQLPPGPGGTCTDRVYHVVTFEAVSPVLDGVYIRNGLADSATDTADTRGGGVVIASGAAPLLNDCVIETCLADFDGGGMLIIGSDPVLTDVVFRTNTADDGGGVSVVNNSNPIFEHCRFLSNQASKEGAGLWRSGGGSPTISLAWCTFAGNVVGNTGGGIAATGECTIEAVNCLFTNNEATNSNGGAIFLGDAFVGCTLNLRHSTMAYNEALAGAGGGIYADTPNSLNIQNSIIHFNVDSGSVLLNAQVTYGTVPTLRYSNIQGLSYDSAWASQPGMIEADPRFFSTTDLRLLDSSPAIDAGDNNLLPGTPSGCSTWLTEDLTGGDRRLDGPVADTGLDAGCAPIVDMGAIEAPPTTGATTWDIAADWDDEDNPGFPWSYNRDLDDPETTLQPDYFSNGSMQHAWAEASFPAHGHIATFFKVSTTNIPGSIGTIPLGSVVMHTHDPANSPAGYENAIANFAWTSPINGPIDVSGGLWLVRPELGRTTRWTLTLNGETLSTGAVTPGSPGSAAMPVDLSTGSGGGTALDRINVHEGDVLRLELQRGVGNSFGTLTGVVLSVSNHGFYHHGLAHNALGDAEMTVNADGDLLITNIGDNAWDDGVRIELPGDTEGAVIGLELQGLDAVDDGVAFNLLNEGPGGSMQHIASIHMTRRIDGLVDIEALVPTQAFETIALLLHDGHLIASIALTDPWSAADQFAIARAPDRIGIISQASATAGPAARSGGGPIPAGLFYAWDDDAQVTLESSLTGEFTIYPEVDLVVFAPNAPLGDESLRKVIELRAIAHSGSPGTIVLRNEDVVTEQRSLRALGATIMMDGQYELQDPLRLTNIGSSGEDGIAIDGGMASFVFVELDDITPVASLSDFLIWNTKFRSADGQPVEADFVIAVGEQGGAACMYDATPLSATGYEVQIYDGPSLVGSLSNLTLPVVTSQTHWPVRLGGGLIRSHAFDTWDMGDNVVAGLPGPEAIEVEDASLPGPMTFIGDRILIRPLGVSWPLVAQLESVHLRASGIPELTITDISSGGNATFAGFDMDAPLEARYDTFGFDERLLRAEVLRLGNPLAPAMGGATVDLGLFSAFGVTLHLGDSPAGPADFRVTLLDGLADDQTTLGTHLAASDGAMMEQSFDAGPLGATSYDIATYSGPTMQGSFTSLSSPRLVSLLVPEMTSRLAAGSDGFEIDLPTPTDFEVRDGAAVVGVSVAVDRVVVTHNGSAATIHTLLGRVESTASTMAISSIQAASSGDTYLRSTAQSRLGGQSGDEGIVAHIGSSGQDGVIVDVPDTDAVRVFHTFGPDIEGMFSNGDFTKGLTSTLSAQIVGAETIVTAEFAQIGGSEVLAEVLQGSNVVGSGEFANGPVAAVDSADYAVWVSSTASVDAGTPSLTLSLGMSVPITLTDRGTFVGDAIRVTPTDATIPVPGVHAVTVRAIGPSDSTGSFAIDAVDGGEPPCVPDLNGDGVLDFFDVQMFLSLFSAHDPAADFTNDGVFDFFDVQAFLQAFAAGCP